MVYKLQKLHVVYVLLTTQNWLPWQRPLRNWKTGLDQENSRKYLPFGEKIVKIGPVDTEIALLIVKKNKEIKKKLTQAKYTEWAKKCNHLLSNPFIHLLQLCF